MLIALLLALLCMNLYYVTLLSLLKFKKSIVDIRIFQSEITLFDAQGKDYRARLSSNSFISTKFCLLVFDLTADKTTKIVLLSNDNIEDKNSLRRFRVWAKFGHSIPQNSALLE